MTPDLKAALQESLKQEDEAVKARLQEPVPEGAPAKGSKPGKPAVKKAAPAKPGPAAQAKTAAPAEPVKPVKAKPAAKTEAPAKAAARAEKASAQAKPAPADAPKVVKVSRESFSLPESEAATLKSLRTAVAREGRITTKSELVRAGIQLLTGLQPAQLLIALDTLQPVVKKKKKK